MIKDNNKTYTIVKEMLKKRGFEIDGKGENGVPAEVVRGLCEVVKEIVNAIH